MFDVVNDGLDEGSTALDVHVTTTTRIKLQHPYTLDYFIEGRCVSLQKARRKKRRLSRRRGRQSKACRTVFAGDQKLSRL